MNARKPFVVPALAGILPFRLKAVQRRTNGPRRPRAHASAGHEIVANTKWFEFTRGRARVPILRIVTSP